MPNIATAMVKMEVNSDHTFTLFSSLMRNESKPLTNGITISNTGIIVIYKILKSYSAIGKRET
jgi:hypothetical protein